MSQILTEKEIDDGKKFAEAFSKLSAEGKTMANVYLSALVDKEVADKEKENAS